jgi:hypothetical protein
VLRDRDAIYGESFTRCIASMGIREVLNEKAEGEGGDHEEIDGDDVSGMRGEKDFLWFMSSDF